MTRKDKTEGQKVADYRDTLHKIARAPEGRHAALEGKAAKLGVEIQDQESKAAPQPSSRKSKSGGS